MTNRIVKVLIVDDSKLMATLLSSIIEKQTDLTVVGHAENGEEAAILAKKLEPDVITMDVDMPGIDGIEATRIIMSETPTPVVIVSSLLETDRVKTTFRALEEGAVAVLAKPHNKGDAEMDSYEILFTDTLRSMSEIKVVKRWAADRFPKKLSLPADMQEDGKTFEVISIGASTGGPQVLREILGSLPNDFPVPIMIVNHISNGFTEGMSKWLGTISGPTVKVAKQGEVLENGTAYFGPDGHHMMVARKNGKLTVRLVESPSVNGFRPSVSTLMHSVAETCGKGSIGVILSGMGIDGADGLLEMKKTGAQTFVQNEESCVVFGMPGEAIRIGATSQTLSPDRIGPRLINIIKRGG